MEIGVLAMARKYKKTKTVESKQSNVEDESMQSKAAEYSVVSQVVYLFLGLVEFTLFFRFMFKLAGANPAAGIVNFIYSVSRVLMAPYRFIFPVNQVEGAVFEWSVLVAMGFYALFAWIIIKIVNIVFVADSA